MSRSITSIGTTPFKSYDLEGPVQPEMSWLPISFRKETGMGSYVMRMQPGARTIAHDHPGHEEFLVLEGELVDSDGTVFRTGDFVSFAPGTHHSSHTDTGCVLAVFEWRDQS
ncbi:MAG TPA: cupin domain-containing protein [Dongiaceae bacterium]|jgi:anti-sigma factor ChrR (cupin superfamily)|nr:cupin domain-containing protein [Dongiaceae bacterium]